MICGTWRFDHQGRERRGGCRGGGHDSCSSSRGERKLTERAIGGAGARFRLGIVHTGATMFGGGIGWGFAGCGRRVFEGVNIGDLDRYGSIGGHGRYNIPDQISVLAEKGRGPGRRRGVREQRRSDGKLAKGPDDEGASTKHGRARGIKEAVKTWWRRERGEG